MIEFILILFAHFLADFPLQAIGYNHMKNKHKDFNHLFIHATSYWLVLGLLLCLFSWSNPFIPQTLWKFAALNGILHGFIDFFTSRASNKLWGKGVRAWVDMQEKAQIKYIQKYVGPFWCVIGFDQFLHVSLLYGTAVMYGLI